MPVLKVGIKLAQNDSWKNDLGQVFANGWIGGDFDGTSQEFTSTKTGNIDLELNFKDKVLAVSITTRIQRLLLVLINSETSI